MTTAERAHRRRFRFSLRMLLVAVTIAGLLLGWIAYSFNWIHDRHAVFAQLRVRPVALSKEGKRAPNLLWLFGETGVEQLWCWNMAPGEVEMVRKLYPESEIWELIGNGDEMPKWFSEMGSATIDEREARETRLVWIRRQKSEPYARTFLDSGHGESSSCCEPTLYVRCRRTLWCGRPSLMRGRESGCRFTNEAD